MEVRVTTVYAEHAAGRNPLSGSTTSITMRAPMAGGSAGSGGGGGEGAEGGGEGGDGGVS